MGWGRQWSRSSQCRSIHGTQDGLHSRDDRDGYDALQNHYMQLCRARWEGRERAGEAPGTGRKQSIHNIPRGVPGTLEEERFLRMPKASVESRVLTLSVSLSMVIRLSRSPWASTTCCSFGRAAEKLPTIACVIMPAGCSVRAYMDMLDVMDMLGDLRASVP